MTWLGLPRARGMRYAEPEDVAAAVVAALQGRRAEVFVPREMGVLMRLAQVLPRRVVDLFTQVTGADRVLYAPDHVARAAYEQRMAAEEAVDSSAPAGRLGGATIAEWRQISQRSARRG